MKAEIYQTIQTLLRSDDSVSVEQEREILTVCRRGKRKKSRYGTVKQVAEILSCHPRTVHRYARQGMFRQIHISKRKVRYDLDEVEEFARSGLEGISEESAV